MSDTEYRLWRDAFLEEGLKVGIPKGATREEVEAWAHSMALIADQIVDDDDDGELIEA